jgi:hypothetical protein
MKSFCSGEKKEKTVCKNANSSSGPIRTPLGTHPTSVPTMPEEQRGRRAESRTRREGGGTWRRGGRRGTNAAVVRPLLAVSNHTSAYALHLLPALLASRPLCFALDAGYCSRDRMCAVLQSGLDLSLFRLLVV